MTPTNSKIKSLANGVRNEAAGGAPPTPSSMLLEAFAHVLTPLVRLLIARGITYQAASELLKRVYVRAGRMHFTDAAPTGTQLSLLTGLNRKEIRRLSEAAMQSVAPEGVTSFASAVHATWLTQRRFQERKSGGYRPRPLPRHAQGDATSFDELVRSVTTDHRPAAVLEELLRLELVEIDAEGRVALSAKPFLSRSNPEDRLVPFAENLGDHARAAVDNVLADEPPFLERSVFSDELSAASAAALQEHMRQKWKQIHDELIQEAIKRETDDAKAGVPNGTRIRAGMYFYSENQQQDHDNHD